MRERSSGHKKNRGEYAEQATKERIERLIISDFLRSEIIVDFQRMQDVIFTKMCFDIKVCLALSDHFLQAMGAKRAARADEMNSFEQVSFSLSIISPKNIDLWRKKEFDVFIISKILEF